jgi:hypothetical protein
MSMLSGWSPVSTVSLIRVSIHLNFMAWGCHETVCGDLGLSCSLQQLISPDVLMVLLDPDPNNIR